MRKKILVTGGSGYKGVKLVKRLVDEGYDVINLDLNYFGNYFIKSSHIKNYKLDILQIQKLNLKNVYACIHLACIANDPMVDLNPSLSWETSALGTKLLMDHLIKYKVKKIIYAASSSCYGIPNNYPTTETEKIKPEYPYALTKHLGEQILMHYAKIYNIQVTSLRLFNVYGTRSRTSGTYGAMFGVFLAQKLKNKPLTVVGNGRQKRDFTFISDVVEAFYKVMRSKKNLQIFNIGSGSSVSVNTIVKLLGCKKINIPKRPGEPDITFANIKKFKHEFNWKPKVTIRQGIINIVKEINYWKSAPVWTPKKIKTATKDWFKYLK